MRGQYLIAIVCLFVLASGNPAAADLPDGPLKAATTSEPPGPGCPTIPGGPGPPPDDDDDDEVTFA
jgi:hypothetical protein